jgi:hypothetical protein
LPGGGTPFYAGRGLLPVDVFSAFLASDSQFIGKYLHRGTATWANMGLNLEVTSVLPGTFADHLFSSWREYLSIFIFSFYVSPGWLSMIWLINPFPY